jgi:transcriptional regulator with XRE-family HTH domain
VGFCRQEILFLAKLSGVSPRIAVRASVGRKVGATDYLSLCLAAGLEPATGGRTARDPKRDAVIAWSHFAAALWFSRRHTGTSIRTAASLVGVSVATLSRAEGGDSICIESYLKICRYIGVPPNAFLCFTGNTNCNSKERKDFSENGRLLCLSSSAKKDDSVVQLEAKEPAAP